MKKLLWFLIFFLIINIFLISNIKIKNQTMYALKEYQNLHIENYYALTPESLFINQIPILFKGKEQNIQEFIINFKNHEISLKKRGETIENIANNLKQDYVDKLNQMEYLEDAIFIKNTNFKICKIKIILQKQELLNLKNKIKFNYEEI